MIPLTLPSGDRRTVLRSFWLVISLIFGAGIWLAGWWIGLPHSGIFALLLGAASEALVFLRERFVSRLYHAWNRRIIRPLSGLMTRAVMKICFYIIFFSTGGLGSRVRVSIHSKSAWETRTFLPRDAYQFPFSSPGAQPGKVGWMRTYLRWALRSGNSWSICLVPFLWFLRLLSDDEPQHLEANIYTLF